MKIWFAGVPGGKHSDREHHLKALNVKHRLITFFYHDKALVTLKHYAGSENIPSQNDAEQTN